MSRRKEMWYKSQKSCPKRGKRGVKETYKKAFKCKSDDSVVEKIRKLERAEQCFKDRLIERQIIEGKRRRPADQKHQYPVDLAALYASECGEFLKEHGYGDRDKHLEEFFEIRDFYEEGPQMWSSFKRKPKLKKRRCLGITDDGKRCKRYVVGISDYCWQHKSQAV